MSNESTEPMMYEDPDNPPPQGALPVWIKVYTKPGDKTFQEITSHPDAVAKNAYIWVFLAGMFSGLINNLCQVAPELGEVIPTGFFGVTGLVGAICGAPLAGLVSVIVFAITTAIIHWAARFFGGQASFDKIAYAFGAVAAPFSIVSALLIPFSAIPYLAFCTLPIILVGVVYVLYLEVAAIKAVYGFGWLESVGTFFLPTILLFCLCALVSLLFLRAIGPSVNDVFQEIQRGL
ncbi:MAG TPA: Yip1 family protein [Anaerolineales bacterium]|nr:Yip1 family protein [Anaerolineales bacterium]